ncbi:hypothetical protein OOU_Y34scaffold00516g108 [Pyricularia oryzae Y34]|uniref:Uncharacterized protein n=1 Tax=Pyricularia oryzae (strain Y34) TaxID=1143189 RepID=A0AA97NZ59_PYRO3|nr:hypothetical protein OOU_Y34scaffold00516g108 [Pyricularia oryzae Y34]
MADNDENQATRMADVNGGWLSIVVSG